VAATGTAGCVSSRGAFDLVGNVTEWVADWVPASVACSSGWGTFSDDRMCLSGVDTTVKGPGALLRGGGFSNFSLAGPLSVLGAVPPSTSDGSFGFRCAR
jgi:formylglycine-generating enzyme required for sulfatase activity